MLSKVLSHLPPYHKEWYKASSVSLLTLHVHNVTQQLLSPQGNWCIWAAKGIVQNQMVEAKKVFYICKPHASIPRQYFREKKKKKNYVYSLKLITAFNK